MNDADQTMIKTAKEALESGKTVMIAIRGLHATPILDMRLSAEVELVTVMCPEIPEFNLGASELTIRVSDLLGVSVVT